MNEKNIENIIDAFIALRDVPDEAVEGMLKVEKEKQIEIDESLTEGKVFDIYNYTDISKAKDFFDNEVDHANEVELEVIDADANAIRHLKDKQSYIGQAIICCNRCKANVFVDMNDLHPDENDPELYNMDMECPYCHSDNTGFELVGQVGKVEDEEEVEEEITEEEPAEGSETVESEETETIEEAPAEEEAATETEETVEEEPAATEEENSEEEPEEEVAFENTESEEESTEEEPEQEFDFETYEEEEEPSGMETTSSEEEVAEEEIEKEVVTKDGKKLKLKLTRKLGDVYEESFKEDDDKESKDALVEEITSDYIDTDYVDKAWMMNQVISYMNDEGAYFDSGWLYLWPDGETRDQCADDFGSREDFEELERKYERVYKAYHEGGLFEAPADVEAFARETDRKLGLKPIESLYKSSITTEACKKMKNESILDFLSHINNPERIDKVVVADSKYNAFDENSAPLFEGVCSELDTPMKSCNVKCFDVGDGFLTCNIDSTKCDSENNLKSFLDKFSDGRTQKVLLWDLDSCDQCFQGNKEDAIDKFGESEFYCIEAPKVLVLTLDDAAVDSDKIDRVEVAPKLDAEDTLVNKIYKENGMNPYLKKDPSADEYWISECIRNKEDLGIVFRDYIKPIANERLTEEFKQVTGYKPATFNLRERKAALKESVEITSEEWVEIPDFASMKEFAKDTKWDLGGADGEKYFNHYITDGKNKFFGRITSDKVKELKLVDEDGKTLQILDAENKSITEAYNDLDTEEINYIIDSGWDEAVTDLGIDSSIDDYVRYYDGKYFNDIEAVQPADWNKFKSKLRDKLIRTKINRTRKASNEAFEKEDTIEDDVVVESYGKKEKFESFKTRKDLAAAIKECINKTQPYTVRRSIVEGYRYDLIKESDEYNPDDYKYDDLEAKADEYEEEQRILKDLATEEWKEVPSYDFLLDFGNGAKWDIVEDPKEGRGLWNIYSAAGKFYYRIKDGKRWLKYEAGNRRPIIYSDDMKAEESINEADTIDNKKNVDTLNKVQYNNKTANDKDNDENKLQNKTSDDMNKNKDDLKGMVKDLEDTDSYSSFVKMLQSDQKSKAFLDFLQQHYGEKDYIGTLKKSSSEKTSYKCSDLEITQNNISLSKSLDGPLSKDFGWLKSILNSPENAFKDPVVTYAGKYIIDGHHRWSKVYALNGPDAKIEALNFPEISGVTWKDMLKAVQLANVASNPSYELINEVGNDNMLSMSEKDIAEHVKSVIADEAIEVYKEFKSELDDKDKIAEYCGKNGAKMKSTCGDASGKPARSVMPQTDKAKGSLDKLGQVVYDVTEALDDDEYLEIIDDDPEIEIVDDDDVEIIDIVDDEEESTETDVVDARLSQTEIDVIRKIQRVAKDISDAIKEIYGINADPGLIVADIMQDLKLISHEIDPEDLEDTQLNRLSVQMFRSFEAATEFIEGLFSELTGTDLHSTPASRLTSAIRTLDTPAFSRETIFNGIGSRQFIEAARTGAIPFLPANRFNNLLTESDGIEFDTAAFDADVNEYFVEAYSNKSLKYETLNGSIDTKGNILLEGKIIDTDGKDMDVKFTLTPELPTNESLTNNALTEDIVRNRTYTVINNISEEKFEFSF